MLTDEEIDEIERYNGPPALGDFASLIAQAREANALRADNERLRAANEEQGHTIDMYRRNHKRRCEQLAEALAEIQNLLGSAVPNKRDHPSMFAAWARADAFLAEAQVSTR